VIEKTVNETSLLRTFTPFKVLGKVSNGTVDISYMHSALDPDNEINSIEFDSVK